MLWRKKTIDPLATTATLIACLLQMIRVSDARLFQCSSHSVSASRPQGGTDGAQRMGGAVQSVVIRGGGHLERGTAEGEPVPAGRGTTHMSHCCQRVF